MYGQHTARETGSQPQRSPEAKRETTKTHKMEMATKRTMQLTAQLFPEQALETPMNLTMMAASQKITSRQLRMTLALKLLHRENRAVCSLSSW